MVGALVPDLPYYLPLPVGALTHFPLGMPMVVALGAVVWAYQPYALRAPLAALVGHEAGPPPAPSVRGVAWGALALAVGGLTHMVWDEFTHPGRAGVHLLPVLNTPVVGSHMLYNALMYVGSVLGLAAVAWWIARRFRKPVRLAWVPPAVIASCAMVGGVAGGMWGVLSGSIALSGYDLVRSVLLGAVPGAGAATAVWSLYWWIRGRGGVSQAMSTCSMGAQCSSNGSLR